MDILSSVFSDLFHGVGAVFSVFGNAWYLLLPLSYPLFKMLWMDHIQSRYVSGLSYVLLELIPPRETEKSPLPMELIFSGLAGVMKGNNVIEEYVQGQLPASFSLEIVGEDGAAHMYIRTQKGFRNLVEAHFYAQYPDMEIVEVPDYTDNVPRTIPNNDWNIWGSDLEFVKPDLYPIRTYRFFEEDVTGKMVDPLAGLVESMGKLPPGQRMWFQMLIVPEKDSWYKTGEETIEEFIGKKKVESVGIFAKIWTDFADFFANVLRVLLFGPPEFTALAAAEKKDEQPIEFRLSPGQKDVLKALESNLGKQMYRVKMRFLYLGRQSGFDKSHVSAFFGSLKQFSDQNLNGFKPNDASKTQANYLFVDERLRYRQRRIFRRYINRDPTPDRQRFIMSVEELATMFHPPDFSVVAPSLTRVSAKRGSAPDNLPIFEE